MSVCKIFVHHFERLANSWVLKIEITKLLSPKFMTFFSLERNSFKVDAYVFFALYRILVLLSRRGEGVRGGIGERGERARCANWGKEKWDWLAPSGVFNQSQYNS